MTSRGFTLLELLVALFVSAVMFAIGYAGLTQVARNRAEVLVAQRSLGDLQRAVRVLTNDLSQIAPRPIRDELGRSVAPAILAEPGTPSPLGFTRGGRPLTSTWTRVACAWSLLGSTSTASGVVPTEITPKPLLLVPFPLADRFTNCRGLSPGRVIGRAGTPSTAAQVDGRR